MYSWFTEMSSHVGWYIYLVQNCKEEKYLLYIDDLIDGRWNRMHRVKSYSIAFKKL